jgi:hypothetical protein
MPAIARTVTTEHDHRNGSRAYLALDCERRSQAGYGCCGGYEAEPEGWPSGVAGGGHGAPESGGRAHRAAETGEVVADAGLPVPGALGSYRAARRPEAEPRWVVVPIFL